LDEYITLIQTVVPLVPAELIYNLDETRMSDCQEQRGERAMIPAKSPNLRPGTRLAGAFDTKLSFVVCPRLGMPAVTCWFLLIPGLSVFLRRVCDKV
jgi:hypothetical protein